MRIKIIVLSFLTGIVFWLCTYFSNTKEVSVDQVIDSLPLREELISNNLKVLVTRNTNNLNRLWVYNLDTNIITVYISRSDYFKSDREIVNLYKSVFLHEVVHSIMNNNKDLKQEFLQYVEKKLEEESNLSFEEQQDKFSRYTKFISRILSWETYSNKYDIYLEEVLCYYFMREENRDSYSEISNILFKKK